MRPLTLKQANSLVESLHRHHKPVVGHRFSLSCEDAVGTVHGAAVVGRPVAREIISFFDGDYFVEFPWG